MDGLTAEDLGYLAQAIGIAARADRVAAPNPPVGCLLVRDGEVVAEGHTGAPGEPHAEAAALALAGPRAAGSTAYVSLEPCSHTGRTPPCADALVSARVARVVVAAEDPFPQVDGSGIARLREAGVRVDVIERGHELARLARRSQGAFRTILSHGRPMVTYKAAMTLDGHTATAMGDSRWISSQPSRALVHEWRAAAGTAVMVGIGTAIADDPELTPRDCQPPATRRPLRVVVDRRARLPTGSRLARTARQDVLCLVSGEAPADRRRSLERVGVETAVIADLDSGLRLLADRGISSVLCEGGAGLAAALVAADLIDLMRVFVAPIVLADDVAPGLIGHVGRSDRMADAFRFSSLEARPVGADVLLEAWLREPA